MNKGDLWKSCGSKIPHLKRRHAWLHLLRLHSKLQRIYVCYEEHPDLPPNTKEHWHVGRPTTMCIPKRRKKVTKRFGGKRSRFTRTAA